MGSALDFGLFADAFGLRARSGTMSSIRRLPTWHAHSIPGRSKPKSLDGTRPMRTEWPRSQLRAHLTDPSALPNREAPALAMGPAIRYDDDAPQLNSLTDNGKPGESRGRKANGSKVTEVTTIARPPKQNSATALRAAASLGLPGHVLLVRRTSVSTLSFDKGKPGESRGRKANGSNVTQVTMIARPPKTKWANTSPKTYSGFSTAISASEVPLSMRKSAWHPRRAFVVSP